jgi:protein-S-isoprenylcysteine O-methyltransferase Ste14
MDILLRGSMNPSGPIYIFIAFTLYSALHSALATRRVKAWIYDRFGAGGKRYYRLVYNVIGVISLLPVLALLAIFRGDELYTWQAPWILLTLLLQALGAVIILIGLLQTGVWSFFGLSWIENDKNQADEEVITSGLYGWMRHPLYTGGLLLIWFTPVMTTSLLAFNLAATVYLYIGSIFEERRLLAAHGDEYEAYRKRVPRLIPVPWRHIT